MSGHVGDLSPKQEAALKQLKANTKDCTLRPEWDDYWMLRWLRARSFDIKKSEKMLRASLDWRKKVDADNLLKWEAPEILRLYYPGGYFGVDKQGFPVWIDLLGYADFKGVVYSSVKKDIVKYKCQFPEMLHRGHFAELSKKAGRRIDQIDMIFDMESLGIKHLWKPVMDVVTEVFAAAESNYPELLKTCWIINSPKVFPVMWNIVKPFLHEDTRKKIKILGKNWKEHLLQNIDADQLPKHWGGTATGPDGDEFCKSKVCAGGKVPEKYRLKNIRENIDMSAFDNCTVQRGSSVQLDYDVTEAGSTLRWQILSEGNDVGFGVFRRTADERQKKADMEQMVPSHRIDSHLVPEEGSIVCENAASYVIRFDNTYSWVSAKKVSYLIEVLPPDQENELEITAL